MEYMNVWLVSLSPNSAEGLMKHGRASREAA